MSEKYTIRPAGRHLLTIGRDLIKDRYAALVELVKNAYDADSPDVKIEFKAPSDRRGYTIRVTDQGHGMSRDTVIGCWMVPSTNDKVNRKRSLGGRIMQGSKGVGRYATSVLGNDLLLETVTPSGTKTTLFVEWNAFAKAQYLDDVELLVETTQVTEPSGTCLTISGDDNQFSDWQDKQFEKLGFELKKLISPMEDNNFQICLVINGHIEKITPFPLYDFFDYKIDGKILRDGTGNLTYTLQKTHPLQKDEIAFNFGSPIECGDLIFDIRVYDRDKESIDTLIRRGLKDTSGNYMGKSEARQLLDSSNGIGVYRNGFRISPLGDADFDWLKLNKERVQNPSLRIGSNQAIGYVQIQSEEKSNLIEKSARDGLRETLAFEHLKDVTRTVIKELETRRYKYRAEAGLSRKVLKLEQEIEKLYSFEGLKTDVRARLKKAKVDKQVTDEVIHRIDTESKKKSQQIDQIRQNVAIYQGQAALGKIINVVIHEGRHPINYMKNQIPNLQHLIKKISDSKDFENMKDFIRISEDIVDSTEKLVVLFKRLDPLAAKRRAKKPLFVKKAIARAIYIFEKEMEMHAVSVEIVGPENFKLLAWEQDIATIFTNLADNSIYWMKEGKSGRKQISVTLAAKDDSLEFIDYRDTGPGIDPGFLESGIIFEPSFTTKPEGMGLGLAIAGEAASRNGLTLEAFQSDSGAYFRLLPQTEE